MRRQLCKIPVILSIPLAVLISLLVTLAVHAQDLVTPLPDATPVPTENVDPILPPNPQSEPVTEPATAATEFVLVEPAITETLEPISSPTEEPVIIETPTEVPAAAVVEETTASAVNDPLIEIGSGGDPYYIYLGVYYYFLDGVFPNTCANLHPGYAHCFESATPITDAISSASSTVASGSVSIIVEGNAAYTEPVSITTTNRVRALTGTLVSGFFPTINGDVNISGLTIPFALTGFTINGGVTFNNNSSALTLTDLDVKNSAVGEDGITITDQHGAVTMTRVESSDNSGNGAVVDTSVGTSSASVTITNSAFDHNNATDAAVCATFCGGLQVTTNNATVSLNGVSASRNRGNGVSIVHPNLVTIKNSIFNDNLASSAVNYDGLLLDYLPTAGSLSMENTLVNDNSGFGITMSTYIPGAVTLKTVEASWNTGGSGIGLNSRGTFVLENITANHNGAAGVALINNEPGFIKSVTVKNCFVNDNTNRGLDIATNGTVTLTHIIANRNADGIFVSSLTGLAAITLTDAVGSTNQAMDNDGYGIFFQGNSSITVNQLSATDNGTSGAYLDNQQNPPVAPVSVTSGDFSRSTNSTGLDIYTHGNVTLKDIVSSHNEGSSGRGVNIDALGSVTITNITADYNHSYGLSINPVIALTTGTVSISASTGSRNSFSHNGEPGAGAGQEDGVYIKSIGNISLSKTDISYSGLQGAYLDNVDATSAKSVKVTDSSFVMNEGEGLFITSKGAITLTNVTSQENSRRNTLVGSTSWTISDRIVSDFVQDSWQFYTTTIDPLTIELVSEEFDAYLILKHWTGSAWETDTFDNNSGGGTDAKITSFVPTADTTYIIYVLSAVSGEYGHYELNLSDAFHDNVLHTYEFDGIHVAHGYLTGSLSVMAVGTSNGALLEQNSGDGLDILTWGAVTLSNVFANSNNLSGVWIDACQESGGKCQKISNVTLAGTGSTFNHNNQYGFSGITAGVISLANFFASDNGYGLHGSLVYDGIHLNNKFNGPTTAPQSGVVISATSALVRNTVSNNYGFGISIQTYGTVTAGRIIADGNGFTGMDIVSSPIGVTKTVTVSEGEFNQNQGNSVVDIYGGLRVISTGALTLKGVVANSNFGYGVYADDSAGPGNFLVQPIGVLKGLTVNGNGLDGLFIKSQGSLTLSGVIANDNSMFGVEVAEFLGLSKPVTITTGEFRGNSLTGLYIASHGTLVLTGIIAEYNEDDGVDLTSTGAITLKNSRVNFNAGNGILATANGNVTLSSVTSWFNGSLLLGGGDGLNLTLTSPHAVSILYSVFMANYDSGINISGMGTFTPLLTGTVYFGNFLNSGQPNLYIH